MKRKLLVLSFTWVCLSAFAQKYQYNTNFTVSEKNFVDTIAIEFDNDQIYIPVVIDGRSYRFNLDTGASQGLIYEGSRVPVVQHLGSVVSQDANNNTDTISAVQLAPIRLGHLVIDGYVASVARKPRRTPHYDGIIGFDLFNKGIACKIEPRKKIMILSDIKKYFDNEEGEKLKYSLKWFVPYIPISPFMRHMDQTLFDTGARQLYVMNKESFEEHAYKSKQVNEQVEGRATGSFTRGIHGDERQTEVVFLALDRVKFNEFCFNDVHTMTTQGASRMGAQIFNYGNVIINPRRKQIVFQPFDGKESISVSNKQFGIAFVDKDHHPAIGLIWNKTEAFQKGMRQGDVVLRINNKVISSYEQFVNFRFVKGLNYKFLLRDSRGFNKEVTIKR